MTDWPDALAALAEELEAACASTLDGASVLAAETAPGGHSGFTFFLVLDRPPGAAVVRVPPPGARPIGPADMVRQGRIMSALFAGGVPVPQVLAVLEPAQTRSGRPLVLLSKVPGDPVEVAAAR